MNLQKKLDVLALLAAELNARCGTWAIGASLLLYLKGIASEFHDIDIMVAEADIGAAREALSALGTPQAANPNQQYRTKHFLEYCIQGVEVDVMAGFVIVSGGKEHEFPLRQEDITEHVELNGTLVPLHSVAQWRTYYELMGRTDKVRLIDSHLGNYIH